jgi:TolA-binding protein
MTVKGNHPLAEVIAKKLFGIESVPPEEQRKMVNRAAKAAVEWHEAKLNSKYWERIREDNSKYKKQIAELEAEVEQGQAAFEEQRNTNADIYKKNEKLEAERDTEHENYWKQKQMACALRKELAEVKKSTACPYCKSGTGDRIAELEETNRDLAAQVSNAGDIIADLTTRAEKAEATINVYDNDRKKAEAERDRYKAALEEVARGCYKLSEIDEIAEKALTGGNE